MLWACLSTVVRTAVPSGKCFDVEAVAANDVAGHVPTTSGRRDLIHITFDVMSVRKPLRSTYSLKRWEFTIIFNHDYECMIFRNETVNLVSLDCHSYLRVTLANGVPHRKAMVMTAENVSMDVEEEVYAADGDEMPEAQEASDEDR